jgi:glycosidase
MRTLYPAGVDAPFLTNHDQRRLGTVLGNSSAKMRNAAAVLLTLPGVPFLYYGEEVGIQNGPTGGDESKRTPMPWTAQGGFTSGTPWFQYAPGLATTNVASQTNDPNSLLSRYRSLIHARSASPALRRGSIELLGSASPTLAFLRRSGDEVARRPQRRRLHATTGNMNFVASGFDTLFADTSVPAPAGTSGAWKVSMPPRSTGVWRVVRVFESRVVKSSRASRLIAS